MRDGDIVHKFLFVGGVLALMVGLVLVFDGHCGGLMDWVLVSPVL